MSRVRSIAVRVGDELEEVKLGRGRVVAKMGNQLLVRYASRDLIQSGWVHKAQVILDPNVPKDPKSDLSAEPEPNADPDRKGRFDPRDTGSAQIRDVHSNAPSQLPSTVPQRTLGPGNPTDDTETDSASHIYQAQLQSLYNQIQKAAMKFDPKPVYKPSLPSVGQTVLHPETKREAIVTAVSGTFAQEGLTYTLRYLDNDEITNYTVPSYAPYTQWPQKRVDVGVFSIDALEPEQAAKTIAERPEDWQRLHDLYDRDRYVTRPPDQRKGIRVLRSKIPSGTPVVIPLKKPELAYYVGGFKTYEDVATEHLVMLPTGELRRVPKVIDRDKYLKQLEEQIQAIQAIQAELAPRADRIQKDRYFKLAAND